MVSAQVDFQGKMYHVCGGSVINQWWVMTAGHCCAVANFDSIVAAEHNLKEDENGEQRRKVESCVVHPQFNWNAMENDIALMKLAEPLELDGKTVSPANLPSQQANPTGDCVATGWGTTKEGGNTSDILLKVTVPIITDEECQKAYDALKDDDFKIYESMICTEYKEGGKGVCHGDSGSSLVCQGQDQKYYVAGIVSWGLGCARPEIPQVYTEVSYFVDWINDVINGTIALTSHPNIVQLPSIWEGQSTPPY